MGSIYARHTVTDNFTGNWGWPEPYIYTVFDRILNDFPAKKPYIHRIYMVLANPTDIDCEDTGYQPQ